MANEIWWNTDEGQTLYAIIHAKSDDTVNIIGGNTFEAWVDANIDTYDLAMTDHDGDYYSVDFPTTITTAGVYRITIFKQAAASPHVDNDLSLAQGEIYWDGIAEIDTSIIYYAQTQTVFKYDERTVEPIAQVIIK